MNLDRYSLEKARIAGLMHDIGKIGIPESILDKPGPLTDEERTRIQQHAAIGYRILASTNEFAEIADVILSHHEKWDGSGYPRGLRGKSIPLFARIIAVADTFDAMISSRPYRREFTVDEAYREIRRQAGSQFDPEIVEVFGDLIREEDLVLTPQET